MTHTSSEKKKKEAFFKHRLCDILYYLGKGKEKKKEDDISWCEVYSLLIVMFWLSVMLVLINFVHFLEK